MIKYFRYTIYNLIYTAIKKKLYNYLHKLFLKYIFFNFKKTYFYG